MASTATSHSDMDPSPRVIIDIDDADLDGAADTVIVWQLSKWGQVPVNQKPLAVAGGLVVRDYSVPAGVPVTYRVQQFDEGGIEIGYALSLAAEVTIPFGWVVLQDPLAPAKAVILEAHPEFAGKLRRERPTARYRAGGRTLAMSGVLGAFTQVPLTCYTDTLDDRAMLAEIMEQASVLVRTNPRSALPGSFYATVSEVPTDDTSYARFGSDTQRWDLRGDQIDRPTIDILVPIYSYDRFKAYLDTLHPPTPGTYDDAAAIWATYIAGMRNPPPEV